VVYVVGRDNKLLARVVEPGPSVEGLRVIRAGLAPTELVVLNGLSRVRPGTPVSPKRIVLTPRAPDEAPQPAQTAPPSAEATTAHGAR
jgi:hypothetical protein